MSAPRHRRDGRWFAPAISWFTVFEVVLFVVVVLHWLDMIAPPGR